MKDNRQILNEAFFKKATYKEKQSRRLPQYTPVGNKVEQGAFSVDNTEEVKKRLAGTFGVAFGNNSVRSMASRALKTFPVLVSDHVEPETVVTLKKLMEEQYAEYINLLVSNQVVDLTDYSAGDASGNIAIQALDTLSGTNFSKSRLADKALARGEVTTDDLFANIPLYSLLRESVSGLDCGDTLVNALLENAVVVDSDEKAKQLAKFMLENASEISALNEASSYGEFSATAANLRANRESNTFSKKETLDTYLNRLYDTESDENAYMKKDAFTDIKRGVIGTDNGTIYTRLSTADVVVDKDAMDEAINKSVANILMDKRNVKIRDKFEKATFLLQSRRISGFEYYNYLTLRLGLPVSDRSRKDLHSKFKIGDVINSGAYDPKKEQFFTLTKQDVENIAKNRRVVEPIVKDIGYPVLGSILGGLAGGGLGALGFLAGNVVGAVLVATGALVGAAIPGIMHAIEKKRNRKVLGKIEGWERVEALIEAMDKAQADIIAPEDNSLSVSSKNDLLVGEKETREVFSRYSKFIDATLESAEKRASLRESATFINFTRDVRKNLEENINIFNEAYDEVMADPEMKSQYLEEKVLAKTSMPVDIKYVEKKADKNILPVPSFMARSSYAYGSTEIERRDNKDRKYNQPLIMTIKFKERFSDGKFADNELTAVIGILGKVVRIPSEEMEYILKANIEGDTISGFFRNTTGDLANSVGELLSTSKISKDIKNLPQSADVWKNLEKVATLAAANQLAGRKSSNIANAHIIFSQKEIDNIRMDMGVDYLKDVKKVAKLMKRYSAFTLMVANDINQRVAIFDDKDAASWDVVPYSAVMGKDSGDQLTAALSKLGRL